MSKESNVVEFPTTTEQEAECNGCENAEQCEETNCTGQEELSPEELQQMEREGKVNVLRLVQKNRKLGRDSLERHSENLKAIIERVREELPGQPLLTMDNDRGEMYFSLENALRDIQQGLDACLISIEATNSIIDMIVHDFGTITNNVNAFNREVNINLSVLNAFTNLLQEKGIFTDEELKGAFDKLMDEKRASLKQEENMEPPTQ